MAHKGRTAAGKWGCGTLLRSLVVLCLLVQCQAKSFRHRYQRPAHHDSTQKHNKSTHGHHHSAHKHNRISSSSSSNSTVLSHYNTSKPLTEQAWKRSGCENEQCGHYHRAVPEHFDFHEHGPEIHLDIDECGSRVDTHPASLSLHTETDPHEHCCHRCYHGCNCCSKRSLDDVTHHHDDYDDDVMMTSPHHDPTPYSELSPMLIQHTPDTRQLNENRDFSAHDNRPLVGGYPNGCANGDCRSSYDDQNCYGAICRDHVAHMSAFQQNHLPFQYSEHADRQPLHDVYEEPMIPQYHSNPQLMAQSSHQDDTIHKENGEHPSTPQATAQSSLHDNQNHKEIEDHSHDAHSEGHITGQTRGTIGVDTPVVYPHEREVPESEEIPRLVTFGGSDEGIAMTDGNTVHNNGVRVFGQSNVAFKRSQLKDLKRSKRCKR